MEEIIVTLKDNLDIPYLLTVLLSGYYFTKDELLSFLGSSSVKTFLLGVPKAYKVLFISLVIGLFYGYVAKSDPGKLMFTFAFANSLYELLIKAVFNKIDSLSKNN